MKFSERLGFKPLKEQLQIDSIDDDLKNSLWSIYLKNFLERLSNKTSKPDLAIYCESLWFNFLKLPIDTLHVYSSNIVDYLKVKNYLRNYFYSDKKNWFEIYDLLEFSSQFAQYDFCDSINIVLEKEKSAYRFVNKQIVQIISQIEISELEEALFASDIYKPVNIHLKCALKLLSDKQNPDYRNSTKESISAIEAICKIFTKNDKAKLGDALNILESGGHLHPALKKSFSSLYGYSSDEGGIRHSLIEDSRAIDFHEAKFMLVTCSSFVNFLISKIE